MCPFDDTAITASGKVEHRFNYISVVAVVSPTDRPKSVRNRCVIEVLMAFLCCHIAVWIFLWV